MAISLAAQCNYTVRVSRDSHTWRGRAEPAPDTALHPGLAGDRPELELTAGRLTLHRTQSDLSRFPKPYEHSGAPAAQVVVRVGPAVEAILEDADVVTVSRGGTGDLAVTVLRQETLQLGLGAIVHAHLGREVTIQEDPRASEQRLYGIAAALEDPGTTLLWINLADAHYQSAIERIRETSAEQLVVAIAGPDPVERRRLNNSIAAVGWSTSRRSLWYVDVDERFASREQWVEYLQNLPKTRPYDLWIRIAAEGVNAVVHEGRYISETPWHLFVARVFRPGIPGEWSQLGIVREHPSVRKEIVLRSTELVASKWIEITP